MNDKYYYLTSEEDSNLYDDVVATLKYKKNNSKNYTATQQEETEKLLTYIEMYRKIPCSEIKDIYLMKTSNLKNLEYFPNVRTIYFETKTDLSSIPKDTKLSNLKTVVIGGISSLNENFYYRKLAKIAENVENLTILNDVHHLDKECKEFKKVSIFDLAEQYVKRFLDEKGDSRWSDDFKSYLIKSKISQMCYGSLDIKDLQYFKNMKKLEIGANVKELDLASFRNIKNVKVRDIEKLIGLGSFLFQGDVRFKCDQIENYDLRPATLLFNAKNEVSMNAISFLKLLDSLKNDSQMKNKSSSDINSLSITLHGASQTISLSPTNFLPAVTKVEEKANELCKGEDDPLRKISKLYGYLCSVLKYDASRLENDALLVFRNKEGVCSGMAELFALICQSQGINMECEHCLFNTKDGLEGHVFNKILLYDDNLKRNVAYYFDITGDIGKQNYNCFMLTASEITRISSQTRAKIKQGKKDEVNFQKDVFRYLNIKPEDIGALSYQNALSEEGYLKNPYIASQDVANTAPIRA